MKKCLLYLTFLIFLLPQHLFSTDVTFTGDIRRGIQSIDNATLTLVDTSSYATYQKTGDSPISVSIPSGFSYTAVVFKEGYALNVNGWGKITKDFEPAIILSILNNPSTGTIVDKTTKAGIENATVVLTYFDTPVYQTTTDSSGKFSIPMHSFDSGYKISASADDYKSKSSSITNSTRENFTLALKSTVTEAIVSGTVKASGSLTPIENALVSLQLNGQTAGYATTDSSGMYSIGGLSPGSYDGVVTADGYRTYLQGVVAITGITTFNPLLTLGSGTISGIVIDKDLNAPLANIEMQLWLNGVNIQTTSTGTDGSYSFNSLSEDLFIVIAGGNNHETGYSKAKIVGVTPVIINFTLGNNPGSISGIVSSGGLPLQGATINIKQSNIIVKSGITDSNGNYSFTGLAPGTYIVYASDVSYITQVTEVQILSSFTANANFSLVEGGGTVSGRVTASGSGDPIPGAHVKITSGGVVIDEEITDNDGNYVAHGIASGTYDINAGAANFQFSNSTVTVTEGSTSTKDFILVSGGSKVSGTITDAQTGDPLEEVVVEILDQSSNFFEYTVSQDNGEYNIHGLYNGTFIVRASKNGYVPEETSPFSISGSDRIKNLALYSSNPPTNNLQGFAYSNRSLLAEDRIHKLTWSATTSPEVTGYRVYKNGELVASVGLNDTLEYESHNNPVDEASIYTVVSVNSDGSQSNGDIVQLQ
ncbi:carboxypeptidase regulatory-like domain-containing protein [bacterium]|nr:carboxypeptidase regulatory-like domain-containing protein [bacterium]